MNGIMGGQKQQTQQAPGPGPQQAPTQSGTYPANEDEVQQFIVDISTAMSGNVPKMLDMISKNRENVGATMGQIAGSLLKAVLDRRMQQNGGRKPHVQLVMKGLKMILENMAEIIATSGMAKVTGQDMQQAAEMAGQVLDGGQQAEGAGPGQEQLQQQPVQAPGRQSQGGMLG